MAEKELIFCCVSKKAFNKSQIRRCPHPKVIAKYGGTSGMANVSWWVCNKCEHKIGYPYMGGVKCGYVEDK